MSTNEHDVVKPIPSILGQGRHVPQHSAMRRPFIHSNQYNYDFNLGTPQRSSLDSGPERINVPDYPPPPFHGVSMKSSEAIVVPNYPPPFHGSSMMGRNPGFPPYPVPHGGSPLMGHTILPPHNPELFKQRPPMPMMGYQDRYKEMPRGYFGDGGRGELFPKSSFVIKNGRIKKRKGYYTNYIPPKVRNPWLTKEMGVAVKKKHQLMSEYKQNGSKPEDYKLFKEYRNKLTKTIRTAKLEYLRAHPKEDVDNYVAKSNSKAKSNANDKLSKEGNDKSENSWENIVVKTEPGIDDDSDDDSDSDNDEQCNESNKRYNRFGNEHSSNFGPTVDDHKLNEKSDNFSEIIKIKTESGKGDDITYDILSDDSDDIYGNVSPVEDDDEKNGKKGWQNIMDKKLIIM